MVEIETDGQQTVCPDVCPPTVTDKESFLKAVRESGLVGMGGASFPTHVKLNPKQKVDTLVINAAECEPYITSDYRQMVEAPDEVLDGVLQVLHWLDIPKAVIGIETNKPEAIRILTEKAKAHPEIQIFFPAHYLPPGRRKGADLSQPGTHRHGGSAAGRPGRHCDERLFCGIPQPLSQDGYAYGTAHGDGRRRRCGKAVQRDRSHGNTGAGCAGFRAVRHGACEKSCCTAAR